MSTRLLALPKLAPSPSLFSPRAFPAFARSFFSPPSPRPAQPAPRKTAPLQPSEEHQATLDRLRCPSFLPGSLVKTQTAMPRAAADLNNLKDKVVLVINAGGVGDVGGKLAQEAASLGAKVVVSGKGGEAIDKLVKEIELHGGASGLACNIADWDDQVRVFRHAVRKYGRVDVVFACATPSEGGLDFLDEAENDFGEPKKPVLRSLQSELAGTAYASKLAFYYLRRSSTQSIKSLVIVGSTDPFMHFARPVHHAAQEGIREFAGALLREGIVNAINVAYINSDAAVYTQSKRDTSKNAVDAALEAATVSLRSLDVAELSDYYLSNTGKSGTV